MSNAVLKMSSRLISFVSVLSRKISIVYVGTILSCRNFHKMCNGVLLPNIPVFNYQLVSIYDRLMKSKLFRCAVCRYPGNQIGRRQVDGLQFTCMINI